MVPDVVLDANVLYSGLFPDRTRPPARAVDAVFGGDQFTAIVSDELLAEYREVPVREGALKRFGKSRAEVLEFLEALRAVGREVVTVPGPPCPDPRDQHLWDLLASEPRAVLVTGERVLLGSGHFPGRILSPRDFVERYLEER